MRRLITTHVSPSGHVVGEGAVDGTIFEQDRCVPRDRAETNIRREEKIWVTGCATQHRVSADAAARPGASVQHLAHLSQAAIRRNMMTE